MERRLDVVQPETLLRWHRDFFRFVWRRKSKTETKPGRPPLSDDDIARIKRLARENATWGAERIRGELASRPVLNGLHHTYSWVATQSVGYGRAQRSVHH